MTVAVKQPDAQSAFQRLLRGDTPTLSRALSILEAGGTAADALAIRLRDHAGLGRVIAFTGPPGAGKSTLVGAYVSELRQKGERVAVLAVDPSSPLSGGAVLGDRTRMGQHSYDEGVFIRSIASRNHLGGLSLSLPAILDAVDAAGWPNIILETVGAGQSETEIAEFADIKVVLNAPGLGDDVQAIKAGILEIADILVVNKSDLPLADRTRRQLQMMLALRKEDQQNIPIIATSASEPTGIQELDTAISNCAISETVETKQSRRLRGLLKRKAKALFLERLDQTDDQQLERECHKIRLGQTTLVEAAMDLVGSISK